MREPENAAARRSYPARLPSTLQMSAERIYAIAGLTIASDIVLPGLATAGATSPDAVVFRLAPVPESLDSSAIAFAGGAWDGAHLLLTITGVARYLISQSTIDVDPVPGSDPADVRAFLLGTVFGAFCHVRGIFPLHASAIEHAAGCIAFTGDSGAGKSTMVAALAARGHQVITDDVAYLRTDARNCVWVHPGANRLRLWDSAMDGLGYDRRAFERELRGQDKYLVPARQVADPLKPRRLRAVFQLEEEASNAAPAIERIRGAAAASILLGNTYRLYLAEIMGQKPRVFSRAVEAASQTDVFLLRRPKDFAALGHVVELVENRLEAIGADPAPSS